MGDGSQGVVMAHGADVDAAAWEAVAWGAADRGATLCAVDDVTEESIRAVVDELRSRDNIDQVVLIGADAGADAILDLASSDPDAADSLILISPTSTVEGLGDEPKLFIADDEETAAQVVTTLADTSPGDVNDVVLLPGGSTAQVSGVAQLIVVRLDRLRS